MCTEELLTDDRRRYQFPDSVSILRRALNPALFGVLFLVFAWDILISDRVLIPVSYDHVIEDNRGGQERDGDVWRLTDINRYFVPKLALHVDENRNSWIAGWDPNVQMGKPASQFGGYGLAYPITYSLSLITKDPVTIHTALGLATVLLLCGFTYLFCCELGLRSSVALFVTVMVGLNSRSAYWMGFAQFISWAAWGMGIAWLTARHARKMEVSSWLLLVTFTFCLVIGARHQATIRMVYFLGPLFVWLVIVRSPSWPRALVCFLSLVLACVVGGLLSLPLVMDLLATVNDSVRGAGDTSGFVLSIRKDFLTIQLPTLWNLHVFGSPADTEYPFNTSAMTLSPFVVGILAGLPVYLRTSRRDLIALLVAVIGFYLLVAVSEPFHGFAIRFLGLGLSRSNPIGGLYLPCFVLAGVLIASANELSRRARQIAALSSAVSSIAIAVTILIKSQYSLDHSGWIIGLVGSLLAVAFYLRVSLIWPLTWGVMFVVLLSSKAIVSLPASEAVVTSELAALVKNAAPNGRVAKSKSVRAVIPSNVEIIVGVDSVHSYDSLSSERYNRFMHSLGTDGGAVFGRHWDFLELQNLDLDLLNDLGVTVLLTGSDAERPEGWRLVGIYDGVFVYKNPNPISLYFHEIHDTSGGKDRIPVVPVLSMADLTRFELEPVSAASTVVVLRQFHRGWIARTGDGRTLETFPYKGFFLAATIPSGTKRVTFEYASTVQWAWIGLVFTGMSVIWSLGIVLSGTARARMDGRK